MATKNSKPKHSQLWRLVLSLLLLLVLTYLVVSHHNLARQSAHTLSHANYGWFGLALAGSALTFAVAASIYKLLALHRLRYSQTLLVEIAASFANRLLPAGLGGLGLHGLYLHRQHHSTAEATAVVSINNLLGITAHLSLLVLVGLFSPSIITKVTHRASHHIAWTYVSIGLAIVVLVLALVPYIRRTLIRFLRNLATSLRQLRLRSVTAAYGTALGLTITYTAVLYCSARAVHLSFSPLQMFIVFSIGMLAGTATPTPGGLVGIEAGLYAGFIGYGAPAPAAAAATLIYRLCTYWLPLLPGFAALLMVRQRKLV